MKGKYHFFRTYDEFFRRVFSTLSGITRTEKFWCCQRYEFTKFPSPAAEASSTNSRDQFRLCSVRKWLKSSSYLRCTQYVDRSLLKIVQNLWLEFCSCIIILRFCESYLCHVRLLRIIRNLQKNYLSKERETSYDIFKGPINSCLATIRKILLKCDLHSFWQYINLCSTKLFLKFKVYVQNHYRCTCPPHRNYRVWRSTWIFSTAGVLTEWSHLAGPRMNTL